MSEYYIDKGVKFVEEDVYSEGCLPETSFMVDMDVSFRGSTKEEAIQNMLDFYHVKKEDVEFDSCGEEGRMDIGLLENADAHRASDSEIELWKQGKLKLYAVTYTHNLCKKSTESSL